MNNKIKKVLLQALDRAEADTAKQILKDEEKLWKEMDAPCLLGEILNQLTKNELDKIRRCLNLRNLSSMKKKDLSYALEILIPNQTRRIMEFFDAERYGLVQHILNNGGYIHINSFSLKTINYFKDRGIIFPGLQDGKKILTMPLEVSEAF